MEWIELMKGWNIKVLYEGETQQLERAKLFQPRGVAVLDLVSTASLSGESLPQICNPASHGPRDCPNRHGRAGLQGDPSCGPLSLRADPEAIRVPAWPACLLDALAIAGISEPQDDRCAWQCQGMQCHCLQAMLRTRTFIRTIAHRPAVHRLPMPRDV